MGNTYFEARVANIKDHVSMRRLVDHFGVRTQSPDIVTQVHCPIHGDDAHPSARIYETNTMYCFRCAKTWDVISLVQDFLKLPKFNDAMKYLEDTFHISKLDPEKYEYDKQEKKKSFDDVIKPDVKKEITFDQDFKNLQDYLICNKSTYSMEEYTSFFYLFDTLFYLYKSEAYDSDKHMSKLISELSLKIKK